MKIQRQVKVLSVVQEKDGGVRVWVREDANELNVVHAFLSVLPTEAPRKGQTVTVTIEWEAPA